MSAELGPLRTRAAALIERLADGRRDDDARDELVIALAKAQARAVAPYGKLVANRLGAPARIERIDDVPALPTDVFRFARVASFDEHETIRTFLTSGTTHGERGAHAFRDLDLYDRAARAAAGRALFEGGSRFRVVIAAPHPTEAEESSLSYMLDRFGEWFGEGEARWVVREGQLDTSALTQALSDATAEGAKIALLGTSFAFVHLEEALGDTRFSLPEGSRIMQTGGFKGRTREIAPEEMRGLLSLRYGVAETAIVGEYGMTELSSQMYETALIAPEETRRYWVPGWVRAVPVDADTLAPVDDGEIGILRIDDVANVDSVCAIQTADLARRVGAGIELLGRSAGAVPRGCSLAMDAALGGGGR